MPKCSVDWCDLPTKCKGYCEPHYWRSKNNYPMDKPIKKVFKNLSLKDKLLASIKIDKTSGCWIWVRGIDNNGYGMTSNENGDKVKAHRASFEVFKGSFDKTLDICHHCDNPPCINPDHLFIGTAKDNLQDMSKKWRGTFGTNQPNHKLNNEDIYEIFKMSKYNSQSVIAEKFNVHQSTINRILKKTRWRHLTDNSSIKS